MRKGALKCEAKEGEREKRFAAGPETQVRVGSDQKRAQKYRE